MKIKNNQPIACYINWDRVFGFWFIEVSFQVKETMSNLGLTVPNGCIDDVIYLAINSTTKLVHYNTFIDKIVYQYKSELGELT